MTRNTIITFEFPIFGHHTSIIVFVASHSAIHFCKMCHDDLSDPEQIQPCSCREAYENQAADTEHPIKPSSHVSNGDIFGRSRSSTNLFKMKRLDEPPSLSNGLNTSGGSSTIGLVTSRAMDDGEFEERISLSTTQSEKRQFELDEIQRTYFSSFEKKIVYFMRHFGSM